MFEVYSSILKIYIHIFKKKKQNPVKIQEVRKNQRNDSELINSQTHVYIIRFLES